MPFTRPILKTGNWERLNAIPDKRIATEVIITARPNFKIKNGDYQIGNIIVHFEVNENVVLTTKGKILEVDYNINEMPGRSPMPQEIPNIIVHWLNEILRQNDIPKRNYLNNSNWTVVIVNYKLRDEIIASAQYPKVQGPPNMTFDGSTFHNR